MAVRRSGLRKIVPAIKIHGFYINSIYSGGLVKIFGNDPRYERAGIAKTKDYSYGQIFPHGISL
jgi:hypothetical protein